MQVSHAGVFVATLLDHALFVSSGMYNTQDWVEFVGKAFIRFYGSDDSSSMMYKFNSTTSDC